MNPLLVEQLRERLRERLLATTGADDPTVHSVEAERQVRLATRTHATLLDALLLDAGRPDPALDPIREEQAALRAQLRALYAVVLVLGGALLGETILWAVLGAAALVWR